MPLEVQSLLEAAEYLRKKISVIYKEIPAKWENADAVIKFYKEGDPAEWKILRIKLEKARKHSYLFNERFLVGYLKEIWAGKR